MGMLSDFLTLIKGTQTNIEGVLTGKNGRIIPTPVNTTNDSLVTKGKTVGTFSSVVSANANKTYTVSNGASIVVFAFAPASDRQAAWQVYSGSTGLITVTTESAIETVTVASSTNNELVITNGTNGAISCRVMIFAGTIAEKTT